MRQSQILPALQKFYNAIKHLKIFALENDFIENIGCLDTFLSEYRSTTFVLQKSLGGNPHPAYQKNLNSYLLSDEQLSKWLNYQRVEVIHKHPFYLKKILRIVIYDSGKAVEFKRYEQTIETENEIGDYLGDIRNTLMAITMPEIYFSAQYHFVDEDDKSETNIFELIEKGVILMWQFLHAMKSDLAEESEVADKLMNDIDEICGEIPQRWAIDVMDYCYYRSTDSFERGKFSALMMPDIRVPIEQFIEQVRVLNSSLKDFYDCFVYFHTYAYLNQGRELMTVFFLEYNDRSYKTIPFIASLRTTMYRYINKVAHIVDEGDIASVYLATVTIGYGDAALKQMRHFIQLNYEEKKKFRSKEFLTFFKITSGGIVVPVVIDTDMLVDQLSISVAMGAQKNDGQLSVYDVMMTPIVNSFKNKK